MPIHRTRSIAILLLVGLVDACASTTPTSPPSSASTAAQPSSDLSISPAPASPEATPVATPSESASPAPGASGAIDPANFTATVDNAWFPLLPGTTFRYRGTKDGEPAVDVYAVTDRIQVIEGVPCRVVADRLFLSGKLAERTTDYYTQDLDGNVWYFGEDTAELDDNGKVLNTEGTWRAGTDGAQPGIYMEAAPVVGHSFAQEFYPGHAEDHFEVISVTAAVTVPYGSFRNVLRTKEWTPLEPDVIDRKEYVRGVGEVREITVKGPLEVPRLVSVKHA
jgi:hypothetical protein